MPPSEFAAALEPGTVISGKYRVERLLGKGGMGVVVAARHLDLNQTLAIKVLLPAAAASVEATTRFLREGRSAAQLTSPHVAKVHDTGRLDTGEPYLVMELLHGRDLRAHLADVGRVPLTQAIDWTLQAAHALGEAHKLHIIHRDVKPANLFLAQTSTGQQIKVVDFGISKQLDVADDLTTTASTVGTPKYMAPEQMRSAKFADARGDIWSLGIVLYELTTGKCPFHGDSITALCFDVMERTPTPPSELNPALPHSFDDLIARCLEKNPDDRFQSMEALVTALRAVAPDSGRYSGLFNAAGMEPAAVSAITPVSSVTPDPTGATKLHPQPDQARHIVRVANADPSFAARLARPNPDPTGPTRLHSQPDVGPQSAPRSQPGTLPLPESAPIELAPQETMQSWNTTSLAVPGAWKKEPNRPIAVWIAVAVGAFSLVGVVAVGLAWSHASTPSVAASSAPRTETASPTVTSNGPVVKVVDTPAPSTTVSIPVSALPSVTKLTSVAPKPPTPVDTSSVPTANPTHEVVTPPPSSTPAPIQPGPAPVAPPPDCHKTHTCTVH